MDAAGTAPEQRALGAARLLAVSTTVLALGSGAHVLGGGTAPALPVLALVGALVLLGAAALARRPLSVPVLLPAALAGQLGVHAALTWLGHGAGTAVPAGTGALAHHGGAVVLTSGAAGPATHALLTPMVAAHAVAVVVTVLLLVATERGALALARRWAGLLPALLGPGSGVVAGRPAPVLAVAPVVRRAALHREGAARRGPPVVGAVLVAAA